MRYTLSKMRLLDVQDWSILGKGTPMMRKHILVVDDDAALVSLLKMRLKNAWYTVDTAETGWDGLTKLEQGD